MQRVRRQLGLTPSISQKWNGEGITAAILDTGIVRHPDFDNRILTFKDFVHNKKEIPYDDSGHGTHVAGCLAGNGRLSNGVYAGVAPKCNLVIGKVLDHNGDGSLRDMIEGVKWILSIREQYNIKILNISVGASKTKQNDLEEELIEHLKKAWEYGMIVIAAAGNGGPTPMSISPIAATNDCITVGCHDGDYKSEHLCEKYSARGPTLENLKKPDIVAPGTDITSCNKDYKSGKNGYMNAYTQKSGTSMATPLASGVAAHILQAYPLFSNYEIKRKILYTARDLREPWSKQGWGMLCVTNCLPR